MFDLVVGWFKNVSNVLTFNPVEKIKPKNNITPSERGYTFEHDELKGLMKRLEGFESVEFTDVYGATLTPDTIDQRFGPDGGIDCVIRIITPTEQGAKNVATRIRNILIKGDY
ncbi:hypothetical protein [Spirulina subsalsa]|uniref:hypothetical protein n=1 Tax=Spirulina subsalsa TaxID=54311 RepID=UPI00036A4239|nr:hypothetical protein [Spirulina subsalsa]